MITYSPFCVVCGMYHESRFTCGGSGYFVEPKASQTPRSGRKSGVRSRTHDESVETATGAAANSPEKRSKSDKGKNTGSP